jgi:hypothetical protein
MTLEKALSIKCDIPEFIIAREDYDMFIVYNKTGFFVYPFEKYIDNPKKITILNKKADWQVYDAREVMRPFKKYYLDFKNLPIVAEVS